MKMKIIIGAIFVSLIALTLGMIFNPSLTFSVLGFILMLGLFYLGSCFRTISAEKAGLKIFLENPKEEIYSGEWLLVLWPFEKLETWPKQQQHIDLPHQEIISASGEVDGRKYSQAKVEVDPIFYFHWPVDDPVELIQAYKNSPGPGDKKKLGEFFGQFVTSTVRHRLGSITWLETRQGEVKSEEEGEPNKELSDFIREELEERDVGNPITKANLKHTRVEFKSVKLPEDLEAAISAPQIADYHATATKITAKAEKFKRAQEGHGDAQARNHINKVVKSFGKEGIKMETLRTLEKMAQGDASTIFYGLPSQVANVLDKQGYNPSEAEMGKFAALLVEALKKKGVV